MTFNLFQVRIYIEVFKVDLYKEIIIKYLVDEVAGRVLPGLELKANEIVEQNAIELNAIELKKIKAIIEDGSVNDDECFMKIEEIICLFKEIGIDGGNRHDF